MSLICKCGMRISVAQRRHHSSSVWHRNHRGIRALRAKKLSFSEIGRRMGTSQTYIHKCFARVKLGARR